MSPISMAADRDLVRLKQHGLCQGMDTDDFFPDQRGHDDAVPAELQRLCDRCPVRAECLTYALRHREYGVWGGTTERQRLALSRTTRRAKCPVCRSRRVLGGAAQVCLTCGASWISHTTKPRSRSRRSYRHRIRAPRRRGNTT